MMNKSNFEFLKGVNDFTYAIACAAENNYPDDPNTTLIKMRMFGEATAKHLGLLLNIPPVDSIGQRNSYVKTWGCGGFLNETNIYSRGKSLCF